MSIGGKELRVKYKVFTGIGTFPEDKTTITGTVTTTSGTDTRVVGVGTKFTTEFKKGDYFYADTINVIRKITAILDDLTLLVEEGFGAALGGVSAQFFDDAPFFREVTILNQGVNDGTLQGEALKPNYPIVLHTDEERVIQPVEFDATGTEFSILTTF